MDRNIALLLSCLLPIGCHSTPPPVAVSPHPQVPAAGDFVPSRSESKPINWLGELDPKKDQPAKKAESKPKADKETPVDSSAKTATDPAPIGRDLDAFIFDAIAANPRLQQLHQQYQAALAQVELSDELPDPMLASNFFGAPIETASGSQRANMTFSQNLPWFRRLDAQAQQATFEAYALGQAIRGEEWKVRAEVKQHYYRLQFLDRQIVINRETHQLLKSLIELATQRIQVGKATAGDVLLGTVSLGELERELVQLRQQKASARAMLNALLNQPAEQEVVVQKLDPVPSTEQAFLSETLPELRLATLSGQPEIEAARLRADAGTWGVEVARLQRVPDLTIGASWFFIEDNRPPSRIVDVGNDAWSVGLSVNLPLWERKNQARETKAEWEARARRSEIQTLIRKYDSLLADLWEQAQAASETITLYEKTLIPQTEKTLEADQQNYALGNVTYDRVIEDVRMLLKFQIAIAREQTRLATVIARLEQVSAQELHAESLESSAESQELE